MSCVSIGEQIQILFITIIFNTYILFIYITLGDLYEEDQILSWLMTQKDPGGDVIEDIDGQRLIDMIEESGSMAIYFCEYFVCLRRLIFNAIFYNDIL